METNYFEFYQNRRNRNKYYSSSRYSDLVSTSARYFSFESSFAVKAKKFLLEK